MGTWLFLVVLASVVVTTLLRREHRRLDARTRWSYGFDGSRDGSTTLTRARRLPSGLIHVELVPDTSRFDVAAFMAGLAADLAGAQQEAQRFWLHDWASHRPAGPLLWEGDQA